MVRSRGCCPTALSSYLGLEAESFPRNVATSASCSGGTQIYKPATTTHSTAGRFALGNAKPSVDASRIFPRKPSRPSQARVQQLLATVPPEHEAEVATFLEKLSASNPK
eukprot:309060-Chlamydomonas_euryale.AAC.1